MLQPIRLALVDDHPAIALALQTAIERGEPGGGAIRLVGTARTPEDGIALVRRSGPDAPDVILCDIQLRAGTDGLHMRSEAAAAGAALTIDASDRGTRIELQWPRPA